MNDTAIFDYDNISISYESASEVVKYKFDSSFQKRYKESEFDYEPQQTHYSKWQQFKDWLLNKIQSLFNLTDQQKAADWTEKLINFLAILLVTVVVYFIAKAILNHQGSWILSRSNSSKGLNYSHDEEQIHHLNFEELINKEIKAKNYRLAIRYYYLKTLKRLSDKAMIQWDINKTNTDYQYEIKSPELREKFVEICYLYDYIWYGEFSIDEQMFLQAEIRFKKLLESV